MPLNRTDSEKPKVVERLYALYEQQQLPDGIVTNDDVVEAIRATNARLSTANPANFLKDIVRFVHANSIWPDSLKQKRITARQRYGAKRVFQFVPYAGEQREPFPDRFLPSQQDTAEHSLQSASMSFVARRLGRREETWLTQVAVNLRIIETQLSIFSPLRARLRDVTHLQMGMKTQPEIDAVFLASFGESSDLTAPTALHMLISCEAKQLNQRILEDQIREQVAKAIEITAGIRTPEINAVKPIAITVRRHRFADRQDTAIYVVEFEHIARSEFDEKWRRDNEADERLYTMPLTAVSKALYRVSPPVSGLNT